MSRTLKKAKFHLQKHVPKPKHFQIRRQTYRPNRTDHRNHKNKTVKGNSEVMYAGMTADTFRMMSLGSAIPVTEQTSLTVDP